jgi:fucose 4-O-acetylase-like acetyltransferase
MQLEPSRRIAANDYGRGIGIFLVVLGHALIGLAEHGIVTESTPGRMALLRAAVAWIYAFHMPLFFFLSGTLIERSVRKPFSEVLSSRLRVIAWPYVVWSLLQEALREMTGISQSSPSDWWRILYRPIMQFWFLYVLFWLSLAYYGLRRLGIPRLGVLLIAAVLHAGHLYTTVPADVSWMYHEFCKYGLYLASGAVAAEWFERRTIPFTSSVIVRLLTACAGYEVIGVCLARDWPVSPTVLAFVGILASLAVASLLATCRVAPFVERWGLLSLQIYVAHTIVAAATRSLLLRCGVLEPLTQLIAQTAAGIYGPIALYDVSRRLGCDWIFTLRRARTPGERSVGERRV